MQLFVDSYHVDVLKIIISAEFCNEKVAAIPIDPSDRNRNRTETSPLFETDCGVKFFSSNAACRYLFSKRGKKVDPVTDAWLQWEKTVFQACVANYLDSVKWPKLTDELKYWLSYLNAVITQQNKLSLSAAVDLVDIIVWLCLCPIYFFDLSSKEVETYEKLCQWFQRLKREKAFHGILDKIPLLSNTSTKKSSELRSSLYFTAAVAVDSLKNFLPVVISGFESLQVSAKDEEENIKEHICTDDEITSAYVTWLSGRNGLPPQKNKEIPKLPKEGERNILITSALPYVNNIPHLGNIIGSVLSADVFARYCRLRNYNTLYVCGTDEYGTATETKAIELGLSPREICDKYNKLHSEIYDWFNISFDYFGRTTTEQQTAIAQDIFMKLHQRDFLIEDTVAQLYCEKCQRFLADRFVEGTCPFCLYEDARGDQCDKCGKLINAPELKQPLCKVCKSTPHLRTSKHLFLDLPKLEPMLKAYLDNVTKEGLWSNTAKVITYSWIKDGLKPRCITRDLKWGTPVPLDGFQDKVFYVWFDAPIGYLSITANYTDEWEKWWKQPNLVQLYQFMAKDNVPFHGIVFPACQLGTQDNYTIVSNILATEYLNYEDVKFSKSRGLGVFGDDAKNTGIPSDIWRFYLLYLRPENQDTYFSWSDLMLKNNSELLNNLGNFINRALMFISNNFGGVIPEMTLRADDKKLLAQVGFELNAYLNCMERAKLRDAIKPILNISRIGNQYIQAHKPWELIKGTDAERAVAGTILGISANIACLLCTLMEPYMPETSAALKLQLNTSPELHVLTSKFVCLLPAGHKLGKPVPLFQKVSQELINQLKEKYAGRQSPERSSNDVPTNKLLSNGNPQINADEIEKLVATQGDKVRQLKSNKASKTEIDKEVAELLKLKKSLALAKGEPVDSKPKGKTRSKK